MGRDSTACFSARLWSSCLPRGEPTRAALTNTDWLGRRPPRAWVSGDLHGDQQTVATGFAYLRLRARWPWVAMAMRAEGVNLRG
jgi:hypothetical protein